MTVRKGETMQAHDQMVGLYSFPKSGNTWLRAIIAGLFDLPMGPQMLGRYVPDTAMQAIGRHPVRVGDQAWCFYKSHHKHPLTEHDGVPVRTDRFLFIHRHPLDVFVSYLNYMSGNVQNIGARILGFDFARVEDLTPAQWDLAFAMFLEWGTFSLGPPTDHPFGGVFDGFANFSRMQRGGQAVHLLRYEDLITDFDATVIGIGGFLGLAMVDPARVRAISEALTTADGRFFWKRRAGTYRQYLSEDRIAAFEARWASELRMMGYP